MPSIMVYTEETFYYTDGIRVVAREEYMRPDVTELSFYQKEGFWFGFEAPYSIYTMLGIRALIELKLRQYDCTPEFRYQPGVLSVMEKINHSTHMCFWNMKVPYHDFGEIRKHTDAVFYGMFQQKA